MSTAANNPFASNPVPASSDEGWAGLYEFCLQHSLNSEGTSSQGESSDSMPEIPLTAPLQSPQISHGGIPLFIPEGSIAPHVPQVMLTPASPTQSGSWSPPAPEPIPDDYYASVVRSTQGGNRIMVDNFEAFADRHHVDRSAALEVCRKMFESHYNLAPTVPGGIDYEGNAWQTLLQYVRYNSALDVVEWRPHDLDLVAVQLDEIIAEQRARQDDQYVPYQDIIEGPTEGPWLFD